MQMSVLVEVTHPSLQSAILKAVTGSPKIALLKSSLSRAEFASRERPPKRLSYIPSNLEHKFSYQRKKQQIKNMLNFIVR